MRRRAQRGTSVRELRLARATCAVAAPPLCVLVALLTLALPGLASASGLTDVGEELRAGQHRAPAERPEVELDGALRLRGELLHNLDLDRGLTPSGRALFAVPLSGGQTLGHADLRLRTALSVRSPARTLGVHLRLDVLDVAMGADPLGRPPTGRAPTPAASPGQLSGGGLLVREAWGEVLTPLGVLAAGRMGNHWGLGILSGAADCEGCDHLDAADRVAFATALVGHLWAVSWDFTASGPLAPRADGTRLVDLDPADDVRSLTFVVARLASEPTRARRAGAGRMTLEYGAWLSHRWQTRDVPGWWLPVAQPSAVDARSSMARGYRATAVDGWLRLGGPTFRVEAEAALLFATVDEPSLVPGVRFGRPVTSTQLGAAVETAWRARPRLEVGVDLGYASGDDAPGFGAFPDPGATAPAPGELDGAQASLPFDDTVDNFRFHPDYRIDRILFREVIGTVTDALYLRPHVSWRALDIGEAARLHLGLSVVASRAVFASSTPGGEAPLGIEVDPTIRYETREGFALSLEPAVLFPLAGLHNPDAGLDARPAARLEVRAVYAF